MTNMVQACTNQFIDIICPGPSRINLRECLAQKLMSENAKGGYRRVKSIEQQFDQQLSALFKVMNVSQKGSIPKKIVELYFVLVSQEPTHFEKRVNNLSLHTFQQEQLEWKL